MLAKIFCVTVFVIPPNDVPFDSTGFVNSPGSIKMSLVMFRACLAVNS